MYHVAKQWQLSRYMTLLIRQGILYFFAYVLVSSFLSSLLLSKLAKLLTELMVTLRYSILLFILIELLNVYGYVPTDGWHFDLMLMLQYVPMFTLTPRFILSIRELYALDVQGRRGGGVDTGFGLSLSGREADETRRVFANVEQNEGLSVEDVEEILTG